MSDTIEQKCLAKGVKLTDQRKTIARVVSESKKIMESRIIQMLMNSIKGYLKLIPKSVLPQFTEL